MSPRHVGIRGFALLALLGALCACDPSVRDREAKPPAAQEKVAAAPLSQQQVDELSGLCEKTSREQFRRAWKDGSETTVEGKTTAAFRHYYNQRLSTCFYLLSLNSGSTRRKMLYDVNGGELYGEYLGPATVESPQASFPKTCRVESFYCASGGEWDVLVRPYMED